MFVKKKKCNGEIKEMNKPQKLTSSESMVWHSHTTPTRHRQYCFK